MNWWIGLITFLFGWVALWFKLEWVFEHRPAWERAVIGLLVMLLALGVIGACALG